MNSFFQSKMEHLRPLFKVITVFTVDSNVIYQDITVGVKFRIDMWNECVLHFIEKCIWDILFSFIHALINELSIRIKGAPQERGHMTHVTDIMFDISVCYIRTKPFFWMIYIYRMYCLGVNVSNICKFKFLFF